jgi:plastocyanin
MVFRSRMLLTALTLTATVGTQGWAQATHVIRLIANPKKDAYRFEPAEVRARPNDVLVFRVESGGPHSVVFEGRGLPPAIRGSFDNSMPNRAGELSSPLLTLPGTQYRMTVPQVPPGAYSFYCLPHRAYDMRGTLAVE